MARLFISAAHKSSGKTTLSIGLCAAWREQGLAVQPFKKGPDYIDPLWLTAASDRACYNLDFNTMSEDEIGHTLIQQSQYADLSLIEANKGLYDGVALDGSDSNAALAKLTQSPVVLVLDTRGMTRGIVPILLGYLAFDREVQIAGVIFNRVGGSRHASKLRQAVEYFTDVAVLGAVDDHPEMVIEERHLGLMPSNEKADASQQIQRLRRLIADQVDLDALIKLAQTAKPLTDPWPKKAATTSNAPKVRLGICQDAAFGFYYPGDLAALQAAGAELVPINTLYDPQLPTIDGLFIGGGFPETQMQALAANESLRSHLRHAIEAGLPTYAECGGLMYLSRSLHWQGKSAPMVGIIPADTIMYPKPQGRGYVQLEANKHFPWVQQPPSQVIKAHEFHYSRLENWQADVNFAYQVKRGSGITGQQDGVVYKNLLASYTHLRHTSQYPWADYFVEFIRAHRHMRRQAA